MYLSKATKPLRTTSESASQMKRAIILVAALALAGCATKPLMVSCVTNEQLAELKAAEPPRVKDRLTGKADEDIRVIAGSNLRLRSWSETLLGVIEVCAG